MLPVFTDSLFHYADSYVERFTVVLHTLEALSRKTPLYPPFVRGERKRVAPSQCSPLTKGGYRGVYSHRHMGVRNAIVKRSRKGMRTKAYPGDLTDAQWEILKPLLPSASKLGRPRNRLSGLLEGAAGPSPGSRGSPRASSGRRHRPRSASRGPCCTASPAGPRPGLGSRA